MRWTAAAVTLLASTVVLDGCASGGPALERTTACDGSAFATTLSAARTTSTEARAVWLDDHRLRWPGNHAGARYRLVGSASAALVVQTGAVVDGVDDAIALTPSIEPLDDALAARFRWFGPGLELAVPSVKSNRARLTNLLRGQLLLVEEDASGRVLAATRVQHAGLLDRLYTPAADGADLGATPSPAGTRFALWAPTAQRVSVCLFPDDRAAADGILALHRDETTGIWRGADPRDLRGHSYQYLVDVEVAGTGIVRNRVTDPYALALGADSKRSVVVRLDDPALAPDGWSRQPRPHVEHATDMVIYELHVRDFSASDATVSAPNRGKYLAFTESGSAGMRHLAALARAGLTDVHLLPVFDLATVPEEGCTTPTPVGAPDSQAQQATVVAGKAADCYNWGYDPWHYTVPEGSYASVAADGARRIVEFRAMVMALHQAGLRVGMDVVFNHTTASGQNARAVLDRIVPGYYHRLDATGKVTTSTCCDNTATENAMMAKLMRDSVATWARDYAIDSFRFDLMGHQPRAAMESLRTQVDAAAGHAVQLIGEGWNFGEVADGARFVQAAQASLNGSGIGTFNDRLRDAIRGGGCCDSGSAQVANQGYVNGLYYDRNALAPATTSADELAAIADRVRAGLAGSIRGFPLTDFRGQPKTLAQLDYFGLPTGYASEPTEVVNYAENHDNQTLYDLDALKLPTATSREDRARVQVLGGALVLFAQGIAYLHAGEDLLRSKSLDRNSYDSGDWFNRIDWSGVESTFGSGLPPAADNASSWSLMQPRLADPAMKPSAVEIGFSRDAFRDLLAIRASSKLFRLPSAAEIVARLRFPNSGAGQRSTLMVGRLDGRGLEGAGFEAILYFVNVDKAVASLALADEAGQGWQLHPIQRAATAADPRVHDAHYDAATGRFDIPARTAVVFVRP